MHSSPHRRPHITPKPMCDKLSFWMTSNDYFSKQISFSYKPKDFSMIHHNDHFIFKTMHLFMSRGFLVSHPRLRKPRHFYGLSPLGTMSDHNWRAFHPRGDLSLLVNTRHIFSLPFLINGVTLLDVVPFNRAHPIKHQTQCRFINHALTPI